LKIGSLALFNDWTTRFFLPRVFFHKATYAQTYKAMDPCMLHLCAKGRLNSPNFQRRSKGRPRKKKRAKNKFQKSQREEGIHGTSILVFGKSLLFWHPDCSIQQGEA